ncbi:hypothetical protein Pint_32551 [Pistacia integerrima]|uniref:Uncharacterized protein n=1 Tax=Pistacia integerrima TaxID=434235 RepID=A0ACC0XMI8_9ROSI|nr:hypothetical protein Pint_32551 [Pistacia integerrima]
MKDTKSKKKKRRSRAAVKPTTSGLPRGGPEDESQNKNVSSLTEAFEDVSLKEADVDANKTAEILTMLSENSEDPSTTSSVFGESWGLDSGSSSGSSVGYVETSCVQNTVKKGTSRQKRVVAVTGTVANVLGKEYARASPRKTGKFKEVVDDRNWLDEQEVEQFLCSMLGKDSELSMAVVKDVLVLFELSCKIVTLSASVPSYEFCCLSVTHGTVSAAIMLKRTWSFVLYYRFLWADGLISRPWRHCLLYQLPPTNSMGTAMMILTFKEDATFGIGSSDNLTEVSDSTSLSSEHDLYDSIWSVGFNCRNYSKALTSEVSSPTKPSSKFDLPQEVLESLFNISKSPEHEPNTMNWRNVVKKLQSVGPRFDVCPSGVTESQQELCAKGAEYQVYRKDAKQHWDLMKSSYQKATAAYSKGDWQYAAYLSDQGKSQTKLARQADEKATQDIFKAKK